jgi:hypothetical protein
VPLHESRVRGLRFLHLAAEMFSDLHSKLDNLQDAMLFLVKDGRLVRVFEGTLWIGNFLNSRSNRAGAWAVRLDTILKLGDIRATLGPAVTAGHYLFKYL